MNISGWGRYPQISAQTSSFERLAELTQALDTTTPCIVHACGRSYGDSALNDRVLLTNRWNRLLAFDPETGLLTCESGATLADIIEAFLPKGWFLPITPGTKFISLGGAVASDVHGKNHHQAGCFSSCVRSLTLFLPDGHLITCSETQNQDLFRATCGGMGLTGVITQVTLELMRIPSAFIEQTTIKAKNIAETLQLFEQYAHEPYSVAWIDCLAKGDRLGRSLLMVGHFSPQGGHPLPRSGKLAIPFDFPSIALNRFTVGLFNTLYYDRVWKRERHNRVHLESFFYPLDGIHHWNRMYGKNGFTQYQFVLPKTHGLKGLSVILNRIANSGKGSFLAVLKLFGPQNNSFLSFPLEGYTLALDFKIEPDLFPLLDELDRIVLEYSGRLYLTKDVRMSESTFHQGYPKVSAFQEVRQRYNLGAFSSFQSKRVGLSL